MLEHSGIKMARRSQQLRLSLARRPRWGGRREGAGRRPAGASAGMPHARREHFGSPLPAHVTLRVRSDVPSLRSVPIVRELERTFAAGCARRGFRLVQYSLRSNHAHLVIEARDRDALGRGMKAIGARFARAVNRIARRTGPVLADRYHLRLLPTPKEVRNALRYVLLNARRHASINARRRASTVQKAVTTTVRLDPASSARWFDGWKRKADLTDGGEPAASPTPPPVAKARMWLLTTGWRGPERFVAKGRDEQTYIHGILFRPQRFDPAQKYPVIEQIYAGPQDFERLQKLGNDLDQVNPYGGFLRGVVQPFAVIVMRVLLWIKRTTHLNYGWVLVLFGVIIRLALWPLNQGAMRTSLKMQRLQPELQALQKRYSDDPRKQQEAIMKVYKDHGMSPLSPLMGCLPMLLPMPILFALYFVFQNTIEFRGVSFLWLPDISLRDPYFITPILMGVSMFVMSWVGMRNAPPNPQKQEAHDQDQGEKPGRRARRRRDDPHHLAVDP